jgi:AraC family transcriptional activator of tynA and feaB
MLTRIRASELPVEQFAADLHRICGRFDIRPDGGRRQMRGGVHLDRRAGIEVAHVAADLQQLARTPSDIRRDAGENYFLILQEEGKALMSQNGTACLMSPGDMVLIDSACASEFTFFGDYNRQLSLHLPRGEMHARFTYDLIRGGISVPRHDPTNLALCAVLGKVFGQPPTNAATNTYLREAIFGLIGALLHERSGQQGFAGIDSDLSGARALASGQAYIDSHYRNPDLTIQDMADDLGMSLRQLQRGFSAIGSTPTKYLLIKRLEHAKRGIEDRRAGRRGELISSIAYEAGFSDLSYFQRCFRRAFGTSPKACLLGIPPEDGTADDLPLD